MFCRVFCLSHVLCHFLHLGLMVLFFVFIPGPFVNQSLGFAQPDSSPRLFFLMGCHFDDDDLDPNCWFGEEPDEELDAWNAVLQGGSSLEGSAWDVPPNMEEDTPRRQLPSPSTPQHHGSSSSSSLTVSSPLRATSHCSPSRLPQSPCRLPLASAATSDSYSEVHDLETLPVNTPVNKRTREPDVHDSTPVKFRLKGKTTPPGASKVEKPESSSLDEADLVKLMKKHTKHQRLRDFWQAKKYKVYRDLYHDVPRSEVAEKCRQEFQEMDRQQQLNWLQQELHLQFNCCPPIAGLEPEQHVLDVEKAKMEAEGRAKHEELFHKYRTKGCLGTWNGDWLLKDTAWMNLCKEFDHSAEWRSRAVDHPGFRNLCEHFDKFLFERCKHLGYEKCSWQAELSLNSEDIGRVHWHGFWHSQQDRVHGGFEAGWTFRDSKPILIKCTARGRHVPRFLDRGHFYCQVDKQGWICRSTNWVKLQEFPVEQKWVIGLWKLRKLTHEVAKKEIVLARGHTPSYLKEIEFVEEKERADATLLQSQEIQKKLDLCAKPYRTVLDVMLWQQQYTDISNSLCTTTRFKFLVLNGPSRYGKTQFASHLYPDTLIVPCQGVMEPNLKTFKCGFHKAIVFDEISSECIVQNKALFQANQNGALLGQSKCNEHAYHVFCYGIPMIMSMNDWMEKKLKPSEEEWLVANAVVYQVNSKLWLEHGDEELDGEIEV